MSAKAVSYATACREAAIHCDLPGYTTAAALRALADLIDQCERFNMDAGDATHLIAGLQAGYTPPEDGK